MSLGGAVRHPTLKSPKWVNNKGIIDSVGVQRTNGNSRHRPMDKLRIWGSGVRLFGRASNFNLLCQHRGSNEMMFRAAVFSTSAKKDIPPRCSLGGLKDRVYARWIEGPAVGRSPQPPAGLPASIATSETALAIGGVFSRLRPIPAFALSGRLLRGALPRRCAARL